VENSKSSPRVVKRGAFVFWAMNQIPEDWPIWAVLLFLILSNFRGTLVKILPDAWQSHQKHEQQIEEIELNARLQTTAGEQLRKSWRDEQFLELIQSNQTFTQDRLIAEIHAQTLAIDRLRRAVIRVGDISATVSAQDEKIFRLSGEINGLLDGEDIAEGD